MPHNKDWTLLEAFIALTLIVGIYVFFSLRNAWRLVESDKWEIKE